MTHYHEVSGLNSMRPRAPGQGIGTALAPSQAPGRMSSPRLPTAVASHILHISWLVVL